MVLIKGGGRYRGIIWVAIKRTPPLQLNPRIHYMYIHTTHSLMYRSLFLKHPSSLSTYCDVVPIDGKSNLSTCFIASIPISTCA